MLILAILTPTPPPLVPFAIETFLAGVLVALALLAILAHRPLGDHALMLAGLFGLATAAAWVFFSGMAACFLPESLSPAIHPVTLVLAGLSLAIWERVTADFLSASPGARRQVHVRRATGVATLVIALAAVVPWEASHRLSEVLLGLLAPLLALLTLVAGLRAHREGLPTSGALVVATLALLAFCTAIWAQAVAWLSLSESQAIVQCGLLALALSLGWAILTRMAELRRASETAREAQLAAVARQAQELEALVEERNAELSSRLVDLSEARRTAEQANEGLQRALEQLEQAASTDRLTGAWNRRRFEEAVESEMALSHRRRDPLSLIMFDLDHFKRVNDTYGHGAGDAVLAGTAQTVRKYLRASDALIRWGGEEFMVMAPATRMDGALGLAEKLRTALAEVDFPDVGHVTMSLGVAEYAPGESLADWIERTDQALYRAKSEGRNRVAAAPVPVAPGVGAFPERSLLEIVWEDAYESGHPLIDEQHKRLFRLASSLMSLITGDRPIAEVALRLETLLAHTAQHFHDEEAILRGARFQGLAEHAAVHADLLVKARSLQAEVQSGHLDFGKLVGFLALDLVKGHLLSEDRNYFAHLPVRA